MAAGFWPGNFVPPPFPPPPVPASPAPQAVQICVCVCVCVWDALMQPFKMVWTDLSPTGYGWAGTLGSCSNGNTSHASTCSTSASSQQYPWCTRQRCLRVHHQQSAVHLVHKAQVQSIQGGRTRQSCVFSQSFKGMKPHMFYCARMETLQCLITMKLTTFADGLVGQPQDRSCSSSGKTPVRLCSINTLTGLI